MANVQNPKEFVVTPGAPVTGAPVDDYVIAYAAAPGNGPPSGFPVGAPTVRVPAKDVAVQADGNVHVPFPDVVTTTLADGTYVAACQSVSSAAVNSSHTEQDSTFGTTLAFFDISTPPPVPNPPSNFTVA